jgi:YjbE family integral membrane protein
VPHISAGSRRIAQEKDLGSVSLGMSLVEISWLNLLLSGDNALVIALACRQLEGRQRRLGIIFGAGAAVLLRIFFTAGVSYILNFPFLRAIGAALLLWIAVKLILGEDADDDAIAGHTSLWRAIRTIVVADVVMSLDNVLAIAAAAHGSELLIVIGLTISVPIVILGSTLIVSILNRLPILVWAGAGFLGWIAGEMLVADEAAMAYLPAQPNEWLIAAACAALVLAIGWLINHRREETHQ